MFCGSTREHSAAASSYSRPCQHVSRSRKHRSLLRCIGTVISHPEVNALAHFTAICMLTSICNTDACTDEEEVHPQSSIMMTELALVTSRTQAHSQASFNQKHCDLLVQVTISTAHMVTLRTAPKKKKKNTQKKELHYPRCNGKESRRRLVRTKRCKRDPHQLW